MAHPKHVKYGSLSCWLQDSTTLVSQRHGTGLSALQTLHHISNLSTTTQVHQYYWLFISLIHGRNTSPTALLRSTSLVLQHNTVFIAQCPTTNDNQKIRMAHLSKEALPSQQQQDVFLELRHSFLLFFGWSLGFFLSWSQAMSFGVFEYLRHLSSASLFGISLHVSSLTGH